MDQTTKEIRTEQWRQIVLEANGTSLRKKNSADKMEQRKTVLLLAAEDPPTGCRQISGRSFPDTG